MSQQLTVYGKSLVPFIFVSEKQPVSQARLKRPRRDALAKPVVRDLAKPENLRGPGLRFVRENSFE